MTTAIRVPYTPKWKQLEHALRQHDVHLVPNDLPEIDYFTIDMPAEDPTRVAVLRLLDQYQDPVVLVGVREYAEAFQVELCTRGVVYLDSRDPGGPGYAEIPDGPRLVFCASNEGGYNGTEVDVVELLAWLRGNRPVLLAPPAEVAREAVTYERTIVDILDVELGTARPGAKAVLAAALRTAYIAGANRTCIT